MRRQDHSLAEFRAFTGCDSVSSFVGRGKETAWDAWICFPDVTNAFISMSITPEAIDDDIFRQLEMCVVLIYDRTSDESEVNAARQILFAGKNRNMEAIPLLKVLSLNMLNELHIRQDTYGDSPLILSPPLLSPSDWLWVMKEGLGWSPYWTKLPQASAAVRTILKCGCKKICATRCKCSKAELSCTSLCSCGSDRK